MNDEKKERKHIKSVIIVIVQTYKLEYRLCVEST